MKSEKKNRFFKRLKSKYRLVIMNDETLEEKASFNLRPLNVFVTVGLSVIFLIALTTILIAFTGLREYIPGYADLKTQWRVYNMVMKVDTLEQSIAARDKFILNLKSIIGGTAEAAPPPKRQGIENKYDTIHNLPKSREDAELRKRIESLDQYSLAAGNQKSDMSSLLFFPPLKGTVTNTFNPVKKHYGIDIVANANEPIKATLDGTVIFSNFTSETGHVIGIQHSGNVFSIYKHNSALLKKAGDSVKAGEVIAIIGNSGELSEGPHLHFEIWYNGNAVNPRKFVLF